MVIARTFREFLEKISENNGVALVDAKNGKQLSYAELFSEVNNLASRIEVRQGDRVVLYNLPHLSWVLSFFALQLRGGIVVPIDDRVDKTFIKKVVDQTAPALVITSTEGSHLFNSVATLFYEDILKSSVCQFQSVESNPDDPCEIIFTSGTWADPKGVVLSQRNILANVEQLLLVYPDHTPTVVLGILPLSHAYQQTLGLLTPLALGSQIVFLKITNSFEFVDTIKKYHVRIVPLVPRVLELLYTSITRHIKNKNNRTIFVTLVSLARFLPRVFRRLIFSRVRVHLGSTLTTFISGGSSLRASLDNFFQGLGYKVMVGYGLSECSPIVSAHFGQFRKPGEIGVPLPGVHVELTSEGEMIVAGENVCLGYWPLGTPITSLMTGDLAQRTPTGSLLFKGRNKNLIVFDSGEKCFSEDLEQVIHELEGVEMSCVIEKKRNGTTVAECMVGIKKDALLTEEAVLRHVKGRMPLGISLSRCVMVPSEVFPMTHTLKAQRVEISRLLDLHEANTKTNSSRESDQ